MKDTVEVVGQRAAVPVAVVDFGAIGEGVPLDDLLSVRHGNVTIVDPLDHPWHARGDVLAANVAVVASQLSALAVPPRFLVAQCASSLFALELAARLAATRRRLAAVVLVQPVLLTADHVVAYADRLVIGLGEDPASIVPADVLVRAADPVELSAYVRPLFRSAAERRTTALELDRDEARLVVDSLVDRYVNWLCFMAAHVGERRVDPQCTVHVLERVPDESVAWLRTVSGAIRVIRWAEPSAAGPHVLRDQLAGILYGDESLGGATGGT